MHTGGHRPQVVGAELVAARADARPEVRADDGLADRLERSVDDAGCQPAPAGVHDGELARRTHQHDRSAVAHPTPQHGAAHVGHGDVARRAVVLTRRGHAHDVGAVVLVEHRPGQVDEGAPAWLELRERDVGAVEVAVGHVGPPEVDRRPVAPDHGARARRDQRRVRPGVT